MVGEALVHSDLSVIVIDWSSGSMPPYSQATANIRLIGVMVAHFILFLHVRPFISSLPPSFPPPTHSVGPIRDQNLTEIFETWVKVLISSDPIGAFFFVCQVERGVVRSSFTELTMQ